MLKKMIRMNAWGMTVLLFMTVVPWICPVLAEEAKLDPRIKPNATFMLEFPDLPTTLGKQSAVMQVHIPADYTTDKKYPLFLWLGGAEGNPTIRTDIADPARYICISMPLWLNSKFSRPSWANPIQIFPEDGEIIWSAWKVMLAKLEQIIPNVQMGTGIAGGFSNGAHAIAAFLSDKALSRHFQSYFGACILWEGGIAWTSLDFIGDTPLLFVVGEKSDGDESMAHPKFEIAGKDMYPKIFASGLTMQRSNSTGLS